MKTLLVGALAVLVAAPAFGAWPSDPTVNLPVGVTNGDQAVEKIATMPDGTTWVGWFDNRGGSYAVYVQRLLPDGTATFPANGLLVSNNPQSTSLVDWDLRVDPSGNCFLAFTDTREGGDLDVFAYLISPAGTFLWGANGVQVSTVGNTDYEADPRVLFVNGQYLVSWPRYGATAPGLWCQRYGLGGAPQEVPGGIRLAGDGVEVPGFHEWVATSDNQFVMMWQRDTRTFASPRHVRAMRFNATGNPMWGGVPLEISNGNSAPIAHKMAIAIDPFDRVGYGWHDGRTGSTRAYVQRTGPAGALTYGPNAVQCSNAAGMLDFNPAIAFVPGSDDMMAFFDQRNGSQSLRGLVVQRIAPGGTTLFGGGAGIVIRPIDSAHEGLQRAVPSASGATVAFMHAPNAGVGDSSNELIAMNVDMSGAVQWTTTMSTPPVSKFRLNITSDADDEVRAVWQDGRNDQSDIYAQNINADGTLGSVPPPNCPGDANADNAVDAADLSVLLSQFGSAVTPGTGADFNGDGVVDAADLSVLLSAFGTTC